MTYFVHLPDDSYVHNFDSLRSAFGENSVYEITDSLYLLSSDATPASIIKKMRRQAYARPERIFVFTATPPFDCFCPRDARDHISNRFMKLFADELEF